MFGVLHNFCYICDYLYIKPLVCYEKEIIMAYWCSAGVFCWLV